MWRPTWHEMIMLHGYDLADTKLEDHDVSKALNKNNLL